MRGRRPGERCPPGPPARAGGLGSLSVWFVEGGAFVGPPFNKPVRGVQGTTSLAGAPRGRRPLGLLPMRGRSALGALGAEPRRFRFDAAVRVLTRARQAPDPADAVRFRAPPGTDLSVGRRHRGPSAGRWPARGDGRADGPDRTIRSAAALLLGTRHPGAAGPIDGTARLSGSAGAPVRGVLRPRRHQVSAGAGSRGHAAAWGLHPRSGGTGCCCRSPATGRRISRTGSRLARNRCCTTPDCLLCDRVRPSGWARSSLTGSACVWKWWNSQGPGCRFRRISAPGCRQTEDGAGWGSRPRPACGPGTRRRASSCASVRST